MLCFTVTGRQDNIKRSNCQYIHDIFLFFKLFTRLENNKAFFMSQDFLLTASEITEMLVHGTFFTLLSLELCMEFRQLLSQSEILDTLDVFCIL